jgi:ribonuclease D
VAQEADLPSYKIMPSDILLRFAMAVPPEGAPEQVPSLPSRMNPSTKTAFLEVFQQALDLPPSAWPQPLRTPRRTAPSPSSSLLGYMKEIRDQIAAQLKMDPSLLATKSTLTAVALTGCNSRTKMVAAAKWMKWQEELLLEAWMKPPAKQAEAEPEP